MCLFADDKALYITIEIKNALQNDLDILSKWETRWDMEFNPSKCQVVHVTGSKIPIKKDYVLHGQVLESVLVQNMSHHMGKLTICLGKNKGAETAMPISAFNFATWIVQFLSYIIPKFQVSISFLCLYRSVCVEPGRKPHCWFPHESAHILGLIYPVPLPSPGILTSIKLSIAQITN